MKKSLRYTEALERETTNFEELMMFGDLRQEQTEEFFIQLRSSSTTIKETESEKPKSGYADSIHLSKFAVDINLSDDSD